MKIITRNGLLNFKNKVVENQCTEKGHEIYYYTVKLLFPDHVDYNHNGFIIDHDQIHKAIESVEISSCEKLAERMVKAIEKLMQQKELPYIGFKIAIQPEQYLNPSRSAYFEQLVCDNQMYLPILAAL